MNIALLLNFDGTEAVLLVPLYYASFLAAKGPILKIVGSIPTTQEMGLQQ